MSLGFDLKAEMLRLGCEWILGQNGSESHFAAIKVSSKTLSGSSKDLGFSGAQFHHSLGSLVTILRVA